MIQELKQSVSSVHMARKDLKCFTKCCGNLDYKMSDGVLARCLGVEEAAKRLEEVHDKVCGTTTPGKPLQKIAKTRLLLALA